MVIQGRAGSILSISSVHAQAVWDKDTAYGVAKAAILPGFMDTDHVFGEPLPAFDLGLGPPRAHHIPTLRPSTPEEIGRAAILLSSPAEGNITGVCLPLDGGLLAG
ncbi:MAG: hypothetical protein FJY95_15290 [Candidatus Handelsmanbacteria bacterium]|nr:hypothetical protein [Candidatus Handelsmanbacteria bacterium]